MTESMTWPEPRVSVVMPVYNGEKYLGAAIDSVLGQTLNAFELIIVDDASSDTTPAILAAVTDPRVRVLRNDRNVGHALATNRGLWAANAPLIARQDADDLSHRRRLELQFAFMNAHPDVALVGSGARVIDSRGHLRIGDLVWKPSGPLGIKWHLLFGSPFVHSSVMYRRDIIVGRLGGYVDDLADDLELWSRLLVDYEARNLPKYLVDYRTHDASVSGLRGDSVLASRRAHANRIVRLQQRNLQRILQCDELAEEWPQLWCMITASWVTGPPHRPHRALELLRRLEDRFAVLYPDARTDPDVARQTVVVLLQLARFLVSFDRRAAVRAYAAAARRDPAYILAKGWRVLPFLLAGERGVNRLRVLGAHVKSGAASGR